MLGIFDGAFTGGVETDNKSLLTFSDDNFSSESLPFPPLVSFSSSSSIPSKSSKSSIYSPCSIPRSSE